MYKYIKNIEFKFKREELTLSQNEIIEKIQFFIAHEKTLCFQLSHEKDRVCIYDRNGKEEEGNKLINFINNLDRSKYRIFLLPINFVFSLKNLHYNSLNSFTREDKFSLLPIIFKKLVNEANRKEPAEIEYYIFTENDNESTFYRLIIKKK
ncbi:hypothetical protein [uncultured Fusobacterium sp.]|uniref:hypothetical protein n=1 Tax=uncultured Fusobacterium sp. TaxID=159267 RepID=UPI0015A61118|nr:hypothetical protein [uncultured Fusobacterium sp.]